MKEKYCYLFLLLSCYILKNCKDSYGVLSILFGENNLKKTEKILNDWNKRQDPKFVINSFKHKNSHQIFELIYINLLLNANKLYNKEFIDSMNTIFRVCNYVCELKESIIPFDKYTELFNDSNYDKYIDYVISALS